MKIDIPTDIPHHGFLQPAGCRSSVFAGAAAAAGDPGQPREQHSQGPSSWLQGTHPTCISLGAGFIFPLHYSYFQSFAAATCPAYQHVFSVPLSSPAPAQPLIRAGIELPGVLRAGAELLGDAESRAELPRMLKAGQNCQGLLRAGQGRQVPPRAPCLLSQPPS